MRSPIQLANIMPVSSKEVEQLRKIWGVDKLIVMAAKGDVWTYVVRNVTVKEQIAAAHQILESALEEL